MTERIFTHTQKRWNEKIGGIENILKTALQEEKNMWIEKD